MTKNYVQKKRRKVAWILLAVIAMFCALPIIAAHAEAAETMLVSGELLEIVKKYAVLPVVAFCCIVGWVLKNAFVNFNNKLIPVVLIPVGVVCVLWLNNWSFTPDTAFAGVCSAMMAVGLHGTGKHAVEAFKPPEQ